MLPSLVHRPVNRFECLLVDHPEAGHDAQRIANAHAQGLAANDIGTHCVERVHDLRDPSKGRIAGVERSVERLALWWDNILVETLCIN